MMILLLIISTLLATNEVSIPSTADGTQQPAMFYAPETMNAVPLVVALHTWSNSYKQDAHKPIEAWCMKKGWAYIHPDFRGPNNHPEATGSPLVMQDILDAVAYAQQHANIDTNSIYLVGTSGGGYTALVMAGHHPEIWAGVSAWVPIADLTAWYRECKKADLKYYEDIAKSCGGAPGDSAAVDKEYRERSPLTYLAKAKGLKLHINAGIRDGHDGSVPISHTLHAFNEVAEDKDKIAAEDIVFFVEKAQVPEHLKMEIHDPTYGEKYPLFRRKSGNAEVTIFDGAHELVPEATIAWIEAIENGKK